MFSIRDGCLGRVLDGLVRIFGMSNSSMLELSLKSIKHIDSFILHCWSEIYERWW